MQKINNDKTTDKLKDRIKNNYLLNTCVILSEKSPNDQLAFNLESVNFSLLKAPEIAGKITDGMPS